MSDMKSLVRQKVHIDHYLLSLSIQLERGPFLRLVPVELLL